jgi:hypothetical protein
MVDKYECESCKYCRLKKRCTRAKGNRTVERNERRMRLKRKAHRVLENEYYKPLRKQRSVEVKTVFGQRNGQSLNRAGITCLGLQSETNIPLKQGRSGINNRWKPATFVL